jgi:hypothetical protein
MSKLNNELPCAMRNLEKDGHTLLEMMEKEHTRFSQVVKEKGGKRQHQHVEWKREYKDVYRHDINCAWGR